MNFANPGSYLEDEFDSGSHEIDSEGSWAVSYGDMITLLLSFFILFFNLDPVGKAHREKVKADAVTQTAVVSALTGVMTPSTPIAIQKSDVKSVSIEKVSVPNQHSGSLGKLEKEVVNSDWKGRVTKDGERLIVDFGDTSFFGSGGLKVTEAGKLALKEFSKKIMPYVGKHTISIRAFTDGKKVRKVRGRKFKDNLELSALRAVSAMRELQTEGIPLDRMRISGNGELSSFFQKNPDAHSIQKTWGAAERRVMLVIEPIESRAIE